MQILTALLGLGLMLCGAAGLLPIAAMPDIPAADIAWYDWAYAATCGLLILSGNILAITAART